MSLKQRNKHSLIDNNSFSAYFLARLTSRPNVKTMPSHIDQVKSAITHLQQRKMIILTANSAPESGGSIIFPAEIITTEIINFMTRNGNSIAYPTLTKEGGVLERAGHTEGATDIVNLAGFKPAAAISEIINKDGTIAKGSQLKEFSEKHALKTLSIDDIIAYRQHHENLIEEEASAKLPLEHYGIFKITVIREKFNKNEHILLTNENITSTEPLLIRIHSSCMTGDLFGSERCDCKKQLEYSLQRISKEGGMLIYLNQEGRSIGLFNKIKAYSLQEKGFDTVNANEHLGLPIDARKYYIAANLLKNRNITHIRLLTNNPLKINDIKKYGITHATQEIMPIFCNEHNKNYLITKKEKLNHQIDSDLLYT
jgi:3,4-dihydroxy 2-butanone 4-phosphate synthase / GTP cyclohydrolase II